MEIVNSALRAGARRVKCQPADRSMIPKVWEIRQNVEAVGIILHDIGRYGGEMAGMAISADLVICRRPPRKSEVQR